IGAGCIDRVGEGVEDGQPELGRAPLAGTVADYHPGPERPHLLRVEAALASGGALHDDPCCRVEEDAHASPPRSPGRSGRAAAGVGTPALDSFTIFLAASQALAPGSMPFCRRISRPSSSRVPLMRTTRGSFIL